MDIASIQVIGIKEVSRKDTHLLHLSEVKELKDILDKKFDLWSNFDSWDSIRSQQLIFNIALDVTRGAKIDIKCDCCNYINFNQVDFESISDQKCYGIKSAYMVQKVVEEILLANARRGSDGTYLS